MLLAAHHLAACCIVCASISSAADISGFADAGCSCFVKYAFQIEIYTQRNKRVAFSAILRARTTAFLHIAFCYLDCMERNDKMTPRHKPQMHRVHVDMNILPFLGGGNSEEVSLWRF